MIPAFDLFQALADRTRFRLFEIISKKEICVCELPKMVKISQSGVSQHLKVLKEAGLVSVRVDGTKRLYSLSAKGKRILSTILEW